MTCLNCRYCGTILGADKTLTRVCRAEPPRLFAQAVGAQGGGVVWATYSGFPVVGDADSCAKYTPQLAS